MIINGQTWKIMAAPKGSQFLTRSDGSITIGMTDGATNTIYIACGLPLWLKDKVLAHELVHAFMFSYNIHIDIETEEYMADWISSYGRELIYLLDELMQSKRPAA